MKKRISVSISEDSYFLLKARAGQTTGGNISRAMEDVIFEGLEGMDFEDSPELMECYRRFEASGEAKRLGLLKGGSK